MILKVFLTSLIAEYTSKCEVLKNDKKMSLDSVKKFFWLWQWLAANNGTESKGVYYCS